MASKFGLSIFLLIFTTFVAHAGAFKPYNAASFNQSLKDGKTVIVHIHAEWCPICRRQQSALAPLKNGAIGQEAEFIEVDYDSDRDFLRAHRIPAQSIILVFKHGKEVERIVGTTDASEIKARLTAAIGY